MYRAIDTLYRRGVSAAATRVGSEPRDSPAYPPTRRSGARLTDTRNDVNLRQLEYFPAIADEGSFSRAAERLLVAQPSLSQQMKSLEHELGGALLERLPKGVRLTAAGKAFMSEARIAVAHAE